MEGYWKESLKGFGERWRRIAIFAPLFQLKGKRKNIGLEVDWFSFGFLTLLFFFESKLQRKRRQGYAELAAYLYALTGEKMGISQKDYLVLAQNLVDHFRDPSGKRQTEVFENWETGEEEMVQYNLLKTDSFEAESSRQYFTLTEDGLALIFATKEYFSEFRISISQLLIRKQLQKGQFSSALHEIHELRMAVQSIREKIVQLGLEIERNIISDEVCRKYIQIIDDAYAQLQLEDEQFRELYDFTRSGQLIVDGTLPMADSRLQLAQVTLELSDVHQLHQGLLGNVLELKNQALEASRQTLFSVGIERFNFDQEIVSQIVASPLSLPQLCGLAQPFLQLGQERYWSLLAILDKQRLSGREEQEKHVSWYPEEEELPVVDQTQVENFYFLMKLILEQMGERKTIRLSEMNLPPFILENRSFYDFCLLLHQLSPVDERLLEDCLLGKAIALLAGETLEVREEKEILSLGNRYQLQNLQFRKGRKSDAL